MSIRVVEVSRESVDLETASLAELEKLQENVDIQFSRMLKTIGEYGQRAIADLRRPDPDDLKDRPPADLARLIMENEFVTPIVARENPHKKDMVRTRPKHRTRAIENDKPTSIAPEETVFLLGFVFADSAGGPRPKIYFDLFGETRLARLSKEVFAEVGVYRDSFIASTFGEAPLIGDWAQQELIPTPANLLAILEESQYIRWYYTVGNALSSLLIDLGGSRERGSHEQGTHEPRSPLTLVPVPLTKRELWFASKVSTTENYYSRLAFLNAVFADASKAYSYLMQVGRESPEVTSFIAKRIRDAEERELRRSIQARVESERARAQQYLKIIEDKFGTERAKEIAEKFSTKEDPSFIDQLKPREREIVLTEYESQLAEWNSQISNDCPHVKLALQLRAARSRKESSLILGRLLRFAKNSAGGKKLVGGKAARNDGNNASGTAGGPSGAASNIGWLMCRNCNFRIICTHVRDRIKMENDGLPYETIRQQLYKYSIKYSDRRESVWTYFCRYCGEEIGSFFGAKEDQGQSFLGIVGNLDDQLKKSMWKEAIKAASYLRWPQITDLRSIARDAVDVCHPILVVSERTIIRRARNPGSEMADPSEDETESDPRVLLYSALFVNAYMFNLIMSSLSGKKKNRVGYEGLSENARPSDFARAILKNVVKDHNYIIRQIEDISDEFIAARFREAYLMLKKDTGDIELEYESPEKLLAIMMIETDPVYGYAREIRAINGKKAPRTPAEIDKEFSAIVGETIPQIIERDRKARLTLMGRLKSTRELPGGLSAYLPATSVDEAPFIYRDPRVALYANMPRPKVKDDPALLVLQKAGSTPAYLGQQLKGWVGGAARDVRTGRTNRDMRDGSHASVRDPRFAGYSPILRAADYGFAMVSFESFVDQFLAASLKEFNESERKFKKVQEIENGYLKIKALSTLKPYHSYLWKHDSKFPPGFRVPVTYLYDERGRPHRWTIFVYADGGGPSVELTAREIMKKTVEMAKVEGSGSRSASQSASVIGGKTLVDTRCSICNILRSEVPTLDVRKAEKALKEAGSVNALLSYYSSRCPEGGLHDYQWNTLGDIPSGAPHAVCSKCGRVDNLKPGSKEAAAYYKKYLPKYKESVDTIDAGKAPIEGIPHESPREPSREPVRGTPREPIRGPLRESTFEYDYDVIVRASKLAGVPIRAIETIGMSESLEYAQLINDPKYLEDYLSENPFEPEDDRTAKADSALRAFAVHYNFARYYFRLSRLTRETRAAQITTLLKNSGLPQYEHERLPKLLPSPESLGLGATYSAKRDALEHQAATGKIQAIDVHRFVIQSICTAATKIAEIGEKSSGGSGAQPKGLAALAKSLAIEGLKSIVRTDELFGKAGRFNFNIFGGETTTENPQDSRDLLAAPAGAPAEDEGEDLPDADTEPDQIYESFSYDGMDYDGYNDEPQ